MPVKFFEWGQESLEDFENRINQWIDKLDAGSVRNVCALGRQRMVIWYEGTGPVEPQSER